MTLPAGYVLSASTEARMFRSIEAFENGTNSRGSKNGGRLTVVVKATSTTAAGNTSVGNQCWPAVIIDPDATLDFANQPTLGNCWLTLLGPSGPVTPELNQQYVGLLAGDLTVLTGSGNVTQPRAFASGANSTGGGGGGTGGDCCGGGTGCDWIAAIGPEDPLTATVNAGKGICSSIASQTISLVWDNGNSGWLGNVVFNFDCGNSPILFTIANGSPQLKLTGNGTLCDGNTTIAGYAFTPTGCANCCTSFAGGTSLLCDGDPPAKGCPSNNTFSVSVCPGIISPCCGNVKLPSRLYVTIAPLTDGDCGCLNDTFELSYDPTYPPGWKMSESLCGNTINMIVLCQTGFDLQIYYLLNNDPASNLGLMDQGNTTVTCSPFSLSIPIAHWSSGNGNAVGCLGNVSVTVTE